MTLRSSRREECLQSPAQTQWSRGKWREGIRSVCGVCILDGSERTICGVLQQAKRSSARSRSSVLTPPRDIRSPDAVAERGHLVDTNLSTWHRGLRTNAPRVVGLLGPILVNLNSPLRCVRRDRFGIDSGFGIDLAPQHCRFWDGLAIALRRVRRPGGGGCRRQVDNMI